MKKSRFLLLLIVLSLILPACGQGTAGQASSAERLTWQEQYDLGVRYLEEGNYEEAIIAFTAAIEIDPKRAPAYVGRGDAYVLSGKTEENLTAAKADYEKAIELDETLVDAYLSLANIYAFYNDTDEASEILKKGLDKTQDETIEERIKEFEDLYKETISSLPWRTYYPFADGYEYYEYDADMKLKESNYYINDILRFQTTYKYDINGNLIEKTYHNLFNEIFGESWDYTYYEYDTDGHLIKEICYEPETLGGPYTSYVIYEYDSRGLLLRENYYDQFSWEDQGDLSGYDSYKIYERNSDGKIMQTSYYYSGIDRIDIDVYEYDAEGRLIKDGTYNYSYDSAGNIVEKYVSDKDENRSEYDNYYTYIYDVDGVLSIEREVNPKNGTVAETVYVKQVTK